MSASATAWIGAYQYSMRVLHYPRSLLKLMSIESVKPSNHLSSVDPFSSSPQSFPVSGSFSKSQLFASGGQNIGDSASASVLVNIQCCFPLALTGLISLLSKGLSRVFSSTTVWKHQFFTLSLVCESGPTLTSIHDYWKNHRFDYTDLCQQSDVSAF